MWILGLKGLSKHVCSEARQPEVKYFLDSLGSGFTHTFLENRPCKSRMTL